MENILKKNHSITSLKDCHLIELEKIESDLNRGSLSVIEKNVIPFEFKRVYYLYDIPSTAIRGGHAHKELYQFLIPLSGSFDIVLSDGKNKEKITLNKPNKGLVLCPGIWRELENFSSGSVCLVIASDEYKEDDYIRSFEDFLKTKKM